MPRVLPRRHPCSLKLLRQSQHRPSTSSNLPMPKPRLPRPPRRHSRRGSSSSNPSPLSPRCSWAPPRPRPRRPPPSHTQPPPRKQGHSSLRTTITPRPWPQQRTTPLRRVNPNHLEQQRRDFLPLARSNQQHRPFRPPPVSRRSSSSLKHSSNRRHLRPC